MRKFKALLLTILVTTGMGLGLAAPAAAATNTKQSTCAWGISWKYVKSTQEYTSTTVRPYYVEFTAGFPGTVKIHSWTVALYVGGVWQTSATWNEPDVTHSAHNWSAPTVGRDSTYVKFILRDIAGDTCTKNVNIP